MSVEEIIIQLKEIQRSNGRVFDQQHFASNEAIDNAIKLLSRPKGEWTDSEGKERIKSKYCGHCSVCGGWSEYLTDFCGNCGADMRGKE